MTDFLEMAMADIDEVFFQEFVEKHTIDGEEFDVVPYEVDLRERKSHWEAGAKQNFDQGLYIFDFEFPTDFGNDEDVDTVAAAAPFILVKAAGWSIDKMEEPELVDMSLIICTYQTPSRNKAEGARDMKAPAVLDLYNIMQDLAQHFRVYNVFGDYFNVLLPIDCAIQQDNTSPYYFATVQMDVTCPSMSSENNPEIEVLI